MSIQRNRQSIGSPKWLPNIETAKQLQLLFVCWTTGRRRFVIKILTIGSNYRIDLPAVGPAQMLIASYLRHGLTPQGEFICWAMEFKQFFTFQNVGKGYITLFAPRIANIFSVVWDRAPNDAIRAKLTKVMNMWKVCTQNKNNFANVTPTYHRVPDCSTKPQ